MAVELPGFMDREAAAVDVAHGVWSIPADVAGVGVVGGAPHFDAGA